VGLRRARSISESCRSACVASAAEQSRTTHCHSFATQLVTVETFTLLCCCPSICLCRRQAHQLANELEEPLTWYTGPSKPANASDIICSTPTSPYAQDPQSMDCKWLGMHPWNGTINQYQPQPAWFFPIGEDLDYQQPTQQHMLISWPKTPAQGS